MRKSLLFIICSVLIVLSSCYDIQRYVLRLIVDYDEEALIQTIYAYKEEKSFKFTAAERWEAVVETKGQEGSERWVTIYPADGIAGEAEITINFENNISRINRFATITISCGKTDVVINIEQKGVDKTGEFLLLLSDFNTDNDSFTNAKEFTIYDENAETDSFTGLKNVLKKIGDSGETVKLNFPSLRKFPEDAFAFYSADTFAVNKALTSINAPDIISVGKNVFNSCVSLTDVSLPAATIVEVAAFKNCISLKDISLPSAEMIEGSVFQNCESLVNVSLPLVITLDDNVFGRCTSLKEISLPMLETMGSQAFIYCSFLESISFPMLTMIDDYAFFECIALENIDLPSIISVGERGFSNCTSLKNVTLNSIKKLGDYVFKGNDQLSSIELQRVETVGNRAFLSCTSLENIILPSAVVIEDAAFASCSSITKVELPSVQEVGQLVFNGCTALQDLEFSSSENVVLSYFGNNRNNIFEGVSLSNLNIVVGSNSGISVDVENKEIIVPVKDDSMGNSLSKLYGPFKNVVLK